MARNGLLIDYEYCTGCHSCEMACQVEHDLPPERFGIKIAEIGPWPIDGDVWQYSYVPVPTDECDLCASRVEKGKVPTCVHHCQAAVMKYGPISELALELEKKPQQVLFAPK